MHNAFLQLKQDMHTLSIEITRLKDVGKKTRRKHYTHKVQLPTEYQIRTGIPTIYTIQSAITARYLVMTTIAAFFSGVAATTIQFTYESTSTPLEDAVNSFLLSSLICSIASAASSLLVISWRTSYL
jgi:hypothetical protein